MKTNQCRIEIQMSIKMQHLILRSRNAFKIDDTERS